MTTMTNRERKAALETPTHYSITIGKETHTDEEYSFDIYSEGGRGAGILLGMSLEYVVFESHEDAGAEARDYWESLARYDPEEFRSMVGDESLVAWALGDWAGPGTTKVRSLDEWLDLWLDIPEEHFASYDGNTCEVKDASPALVEELGFVPKVAYRK
jgi:hypothetical protein